MCERSSSVEDVQRYSLLLNGGGEQPEEIGVTGLTYPDQSGETWLSTKHASDKMDRVYVNPVGKRTRNTHLKRN